MERRPLIAWTALAVAVGALRWPMIRLPGLGRDEATYVVWSHHHELAYAPLLQFLVKLGHALPLLWQARWPSIVAGALVLLLFERGLAARAVTIRDRWIAVALVALCPWQTYAGSILHPDDLQLASVLGFAWAAATQRWWLAVVLAGLGPWAKPSGVLVTAVAAAFVLFDGRCRVTTRAGRIVVLLALALPPLLAFDVDLVRGLLSFGSEGSNLGGRLAVFALAGLVLAGPALPLVGLRGLVGLRSLDAGRALGLLFVVAFGAAALVSGQVKGNWMLPAILLLWPTAWRWRAPAAFAAIASTALLSAVIVVGFVRVDWTRSAEEAWTSAPSYLAVAGERERDVAAATRWWHRLAEYQAFDADCPPATPAIVSDDYGLAAQWAVQCPTGVPRIVVPFDPIFARSAHPIPRGALVLAVRDDVARLVGGRAWEPIATFAHPITGQAIACARVVDDP